MYDASSLPQMRRTEHKMYQVNQSIRSNAVHTQTQSCFQHITESFCNESAGVCTNSIEALCQRSPSFSSTVNSSKNEYRYTVYWVQIRAACFVENTTFKLYAVFYDHDFRIFALAYPVSYCISRPNTTKTPLK